MKNSNLPVKKSCKLVAATLFVVAFFINGAFAQETKEVFFGKQIATLTKQIAAKPKDDKLLVKRGEAYMRLKPAQADKALTDAQDALRINPKNQQAISLKESALELLINPFYDSFSNFDPEDKPVEKPAANPTPKPTSSPNGNGNAELNKKIAADPKNDQLYVERGNAFLKEKKLIEALADAEKALKIRPSNSYAMMLRSDAKAAKGDKAGAETDFQQAVKMRGESYIAGRLVSHNGKTITGIVVKGKKIGKEYETIAEMKKDVFVGFYPKVVMQNAKTKRISVYQAIFAEDSKENITRAETEFQPDIRKEDGILDGYKYMKISTEQSLFLPNIDRAAALDDYVLDILDTSNLSLVRRQLLPLATGDKAIDSLMDSEIGTHHDDEAKEIYLYLEKLNAKTADQPEIRAARLSNLRKLYKASVDLHKFVEDELNKYNYTEEERRSVRFQLYYV